MEVDKALISLQWSSAEVRLHTLSHLVVHNKYTHFRPILAVERAPFPPGIFPFLRCCCCCRRFWRLSTHLDATKIASAARRRRRHLSLIFFAQKPKRNDEFVVAILSSISLQMGPDTHQPSEMMPAAAADMQTLLLSFGTMEPQGKLFICAFLVN